ncbi:unnamed protein product [Coffea canephora]|uniref:Uncharacterized protein n=2 Tax=Coffea TaxID=13442 RepID=A0A068U5R0_COFCA|nr:unnamed protein product [Coffea canephora]
MGKKAKAKAKPNVFANGTSSPPLESVEDEQTSPSRLPSKKKASTSSLPSKKKLSKKASPSSLPLKKNSSKKALSNMARTVRRSGRLKNLQSAKPNQEVIVEEIDLAGSESEEESLDQQSNLEPFLHQENSEPIVQQLNAEHIVQEVNTEAVVQEANSEPLVQPFNSQPISNQHNLEEKIDFLVQSVEEFKSQVVQGKKRPFPSETQHMELNYRSLYIESQKKVEALTEENHQLSKKLEFACGKVEAYEKMKDVFGNLKDMVLVSQLEKATEAAINFSAQAAVSKLNLPETTINGAAVPADERRTTFGATHKKYVRKKK